MLFSIGHSNHSLEHFLELLNSHEIEIVADVRSNPRSRWAQFNRAALERALVADGRGYLFLGEHLGGRPDGAGYYDADGSVRYDVVAQDEGFRQALAPLIATASDRRVAIMCGEESPARCHRRLLLGRVLASEGVEVRHIRGDGNVETEDDLPPIESTVTQPSLFAKETHHV